MLTQYTPSNLEQVAYL